jgi:hypothetical protein
MKNMSNVFRAIKKAVNMPTYNNDVQVGNYLVEQRGEGYDLELTFLYQNKQTGRLNHYATYCLEDKSFETRLNYRHRLDPDWQTIFKKTEKAILENEYPILTKIYKESS